MSQQRQPFLLGHRRCLDGLRGVAILLVLLDHGGMCGDGFGFIGVNTFFVLSGFLITSLLVTEWEQCGFISLRDFYFRRALRLFPALLTMLAVFVVYVLLTTSGKKTGEDLRETFWALFYFTNWAKIFELGPSLELAHTWSLSIEEQFYFVWPALLGFLLPRNNRSSLMCWICLGVVISVSIRIYLLVASPVLSLDHLTCGLDTRADSLLLGGLVGVLITSQILVPFSHRNFFWSCLSIVSVLGLLALCHFIVVREIIYFSWLLASIFAAAVIAHLTFTVGSLAHRILENGILVYIGQISYGLYIWHFPILNALKQHQLPWQNMAYLIPVTPVVLLSYYFIEKPCLRWKLRFQKINQAQAT